MELALGTVQFGLAYGIAGRGEAVPPDEVRQMLRAAADGGITLLDTAAAYGDIEERLGALCGDLPFRIISKIPALPAGLAGRAASEWSLTVAERSRRRLGPRLEALLFHDAANLAGEAGEGLWRALRAWASARGIRLGVSCYAPDELALLAPLEPDLAQLPGNAFDQRLATIDPGACALHVRSAFLQGLLLMPRQWAQRRAPSAVLPALEQWRAWRRRRRLSALVAALSVAKTFPASAVIVGADRLEQLGGIMEAWRRARPLAAPALAVSDPAVIDPRTWARSA